jgi:cellulose biosynthesis protein BcsQ/tetratricopeptide (TPR) repeat protein
MYTITFYSYRGGVGRTLALVNVGVELAKRGRTVLLVDFDLEAPGLEAFPDLKSRAQVPGIVEYVTRYVETGSAPNASEYIFACSELASAGPLWVMPSGVQDRTYSARLHAIDWQKLYSENDGYLLFEDLKAQWESQLKPDYVLIDSRTGHTDVGGICTRQLPDAVVLCFLPNEENTRGLERIVNDIRQQSEGPLQRQIDTFFVPSNVPHLDDEQNILSRRLAAAKRQLGFDEPDCVINRYDSLSLLDNVIFTLKRNRTRLAREYQRLSAVITRNNLGDRDVALRFLSGQFLDISRFVGGPESMDSTLQKIRSNHSRDGEVVHALAIFERRLGREKEAKALLAEAGALGFRNAETMLDAAYQAHEDGRRQSALASVREAIGHPDATYFDLNRAIRLLLQIDIESLECLKESPALLALGQPEQASLCDEMLAERAAVPFAEEILRYLLDRRPQAERTDRFNTSLMLCLIEQQKFQEAMQVLGDIRVKLTKFGMPDVFNFAMAEWGATGRAPVDLFQRVIELTPDNATPGFGKNLCQCLAIAHWAVGKLDVAELWLRRAEHVAGDDASQSFSGWRYLQVTADEFISDLASVRKMIAGVKTLPAVFLHHGPIVEAESEKIRSRPEAKVSK